MNRSIYYRSFCQRDRQRPGCVMPYVMVWDYDFILRTKGSNWRTLVMTWCFQLKKKSILVNGEWKMDYKVKRGYYRSTGGTQWCRRDGEWPWRGVYFGNKSDRNCLWIVPRVHLGFKIDKIDGWRCLYLWGREYQSRDSFGKISVGLNFWFGNVKLSCRAAIKWEHQAES